MPTLSAIKTPIYILERAKLEKNLKILDNVQQSTGAKILLALKGFAFWRSFDLVHQYLSGSCASGVHEARLGLEEIGSRESNKHVCVFSPAFKEDEITELLPLATHIIFNSPAQFCTHFPAIQKQNAKLQSLGMDEIEIGLRLNPLFSEVSPEIYNPCAPNSRLGIIPDIFHKMAQENSELFNQISGLHFHTHCEQDSSALVKTLEVIEEHFGRYFKHLKWINFGGGHHITKEGYNIDLLKRLINEFRAKYNGIDVFLEPGEAVGWQSGFLLSEVVDIVQNGAKIAILDISITAHMPDCLEMPYSPEAVLIKNGAMYLQTLEQKNPYILGGTSCLAGDFLGSYDFGIEISTGDKIAFLDLMHYSIVKNTTFNGIKLPSFGQINEDGSFKLLKEFGYADYKARN
ncbi:MAG: carboxynorspermidine decarboxylase [Helicobacter sp.]|nr:carboxynorspermidine decarboxylase [Helicobacter sp.]